MKSLLMQRRRDLFLKEIRAANRFSEEQIQAYVNEAEHQDGDTYWLQFRNAREVMADMQLYFDGFMKPGA